MLNNSKPTLILAPMAGITDLPFRLVCKSHGADVVYSEMVSATGIYYGQQAQQFKPVALEQNKSLLLARTCAAEQPMFLQLFGNIPEHFAYAARVLDGLPPVGSLDPESLQPGLFRPAGIDINFGCPVPKVMKQGSGCHLMRDLALAYDIIKAVTDNTSLPVSIKIRAGIESATAFDFLQHVDNLPWNTVIVHGRTYRQGFSGPADWKMIREIKQRYPHKTVIANGGIFSPETAREALEATRADGLAIARGCEGNPWLFRQIHDYFETGAYEKPTLGEIRSTAIMHARLMVDLLGSGSIMEMRKHLGWYFKGFEHARDMRKQLLQVETLAKIERTLSD